MENKTVFDTLNQAYPKFYNPSEHLAVDEVIVKLGLFSGDPSCRFCRMETETVQHITCCCEALARQCYNIFGKPFLEPKDISTATLRDLCLFTRDTGILNLC
jgi:hypothetical protein